MKTITKTRLQEICWDYDVSFEMVRDYVLDMEANGEDPKLFQTLDALKEAYLEDQDEGLHVIFGRYAA